MYLDLRMFKYLYEKTRKNTGEENVFLQWKKISLAAEDWLANQNQVLQTAMWLSTSYIPCLMHIIKKEILVNMVTDILWHICMTDEVLYLTEHLHS